MLCLVQSLDFALEGFDVPVARRPVVSNAVCLRTRPGHINPVKTLGLHLVIALPELKGRGLHVGGYLVNIGGAAAKSTAIVTSNSAYIYASLSFSKSAFIGAICG